MNDIILLSESLESIVRLSDEDAGSLLKALATGNTDQLSGIASIVYPLIKGQVDRMVAMREKNRQNGRLGGRPKKNPEETQTKPKQNPTETYSKGPVPVPLPVPIKESPTEIRKDRFTPPTTAEVAEYITENHLNVNAERFVAYYESVGWKVGGKAKMKDWKAAVRNWAARDKKETYGRERIDYDAEINRMTYGVAT